MTIEAFAARVYRHGWKPEDFNPARMKPGITIVAPVRPPEMIVGVHLPEKARDMPGQFAKFFRVVAVAAEQPAGVLALEPGDIVTLRHAHLDPMDEKGNTLNIKTEHVLNVHDVRELEAAETIEQAAKAAAESAPADPLATPEGMQRSIETLRKDLAKHELDAAWAKSVQAFDADPKNRDRVAGGQQSTHVTLDDATLASAPKTRPVRREYKHEKCGATTRMGTAIAETYAVKPDAYHSTFCATCNDYYPVGVDGEFVWLDDGSKVGS